MPLGASSPPTFRVRFFATPTETSAGPVRDLIRRLVVAVPHLLIGCIAAQPITTKTQGSGNVPEGSRAEEARLKEKQPVWNGEVVAASPCQFP
jgi:hypothetical protein